MNRSQFNPKYSVTLSESASDMFPNYQAPDSLVMIEAQLGPGGGKLKSSSELKRKNSVKSVKSVRCEEHWTLSHVTVSGVRSTFRSNHLAPGMNKDQST